MIGDMFCRTGRRRGASAGLALCVAACGRIGVELTPLDEGPRFPSPPDAGQENGAPRDLDGSEPVEPESGVPVDRDGSLVVEPDSDVLVDLDGSLENRDRCPTRCDNSHGTASCEGGVCSASCAVGYADCDADASNGCEAALDSITSCGRCGTVCAGAQGTPVCNAGVCGLVCDLTGTFALKVTQQTTWPSNANLRAGSGAHEFWLKMSGVHSGTEVAASWTECGRSVPEFRASAVNETFRFDLPLSIFDAGDLPSSAVALSLSSVAPGATLVLPSAAFLIGTRMADPIDGSWPSATGLTSVDMDADGKPGVTMSYLDTGSYIAPRVGPTLGDARAERPYAATRLVFSLRGTLRSCTSSSGAATVSHIDTGISGCKIQGSARDCSAGEASFLDQNCLRYAVGSATYALEKVADGASCIAVRAALP